MKEKNEKMDDLYKDRYLSGLIAAAFSKEFRGKPVAFCDQDQIDTQCPTFQDISELAKEAGFKGLSFIFAGSAVPIRQPDHLVVRLGDLKVCDESFGNKKSARAVVGFALFRSRP